MSKVLGAFGLLFLALSVDATTLYYSDPGHTVVTGIKNLDVGGTLYNVDFNADTYGTFGGDDEFWTTEAEASAAVDTINALFEVNGVYALGNGGIPDCEGSPCYTVKYGADVGVLAYSFGPWYNLGGVAYGSEFDPIATAWSVAVPIPAAVWLFGSALAGLGWFRRRTTA